MYSDSRNKKIIGITVSPNEAEVEVGSTVTLTATKKPSIGSTEGLVWSSSNNRVAKVNDDGVVTGIAQGTVTITIKSSSGLVKNKSKSNSSAKSNRNNIR